MWRPSQRIRHDIPPGQWPSREEAETSRLFAPLAAGPLRLEQRSWVPAMVPWRASDEGFVTEDVIDWYARFARGRPGAIVVEATGIRDIASGPLLRISHDRFLPGLERLADTVRRESEGHTRLFIQLIDFLTIRRRPDPAKFFDRFLEITERHRTILGAELLSEIDMRKTLAELSAADLAKVLTAREIEALQFGQRERITDLHLDHIRDLPERLPSLFADAAARARKAGFDGVELHYAHAYTMASFLSATNDRSDGYGGSLEGRLRLPLEVFFRVRESVGTDFVVGCRMLADECIKGGTDVDEACAIALSFGRAGIDFISTSRGGKFDDAAQPNVGAAAYPYTGPSGYECMPQFISDEAGPFGRNNLPTGRIRQALRASGLETPVICTGGVHNFEMAEAMLAQGICDIVGAARQSLADPDWFRKVALGRGQEVRMCTYTNYCEGLDQKHKAVTCRLWDREDGKRRLVAPDWEPS